MPRLGQRDHTSARRLLAPNLIAERHERQVELVRDGRNEVYETVLELGDRAVGRDAVIDDGPDLLRQRVDLHAAVDEVNSLRRAHERAQHRVGNVLVGDLLQRFVALTRLDDGLAQRLGHAGRMLSHTLQCLVERTIARQLGLHRVLLDFGEERSEDTNALMHD